MVALSVLGVLIVLTLAAYAARLLWRLRQQSRLRQRQEIEYQRKKTEHEDYLIDSIRRIAHGMLRDELNLSEGVIRLAYLLDTLGLSEAGKGEFGAIYDLKKKVRVFDTHEARKRLSPDARFSQDSEREAHEDQYRERVLTEVRILAEYDFSRFGM